jgi:type II secretory pathway pseudopilin PulG
MSKCSSGGFALLEVVVALGLLAVSTLVIAEALGAALEYALAAEAARQASAVAAAAAHTFDQRASYPTGWRAVGGPGADGLPGTRDDGPSGGPGWDCRRRIVNATGVSAGWVWFEASCSGLGGSSAGGVFRGHGGVLARGAVLVRPR